ncbi:Translation initiation factor IF-1 [Candidatus Hodgkinia cicadicola]|nr:Translation initiation factor IF-1 [Candidatus Hodgkinia cicadicola]
MCSVQFCFETEKSVCWRFESVFRRVLRLSLLEAFAHWLGSSVRSLASARPPQLQTPVNVSGSFKPTSFKQKR